MEQVLNRKTKIYVLILIWGAIAVQLFINTTVNRESKMIEQVISIEDENIVSGAVKAYAYYGDMFLTDENRFDIAVNLAKKLGVTMDYSLEIDNSEERCIAHLIKKGLDGDTDIKVISTKEIGDSGSTTYSNYIMTEVNIKGSKSELAYELKVSLDNIYKSVGMEATTNLYLCSQLKGMLSDSQKEDQVKAFMEEMNAKEIERMNFQDVLCVYGYSRNISEYVYQGENRVNVNIAFTYDEDEDITTVHRAIPFVDKSF